MSHPAAVVLALGCAVIAMPTLAAAGGGVAGLYMPVQNSADLQAAYQAETRLLRERIRGLPTDEQETFLLYKGLQPFVRYAEDRDRAALSCAVLPHTCDPDKAAAEEMRVRQERRWSALFKESAKFLARMELLGEVGRSEETVKCLVDILEADLTWLLPERRSSHTGYRCISALFSNGIGRAALRIKLSSVPEDERAREMACAASS